MNKPHTDILQLFENKEIVKICAPMVRYSKLQFRNLVKNYGCDLCFTPMILADSFCKSLKARNNEFTTNLRDTPLITQFAANTVHDFVGASYLVAPFCDGVDLNCGCPQRWAKQQGLGCAMLEKPELIYDLVKQCRNRIPKPFSISVKIRLKKDLKRTVEICKQLQQSGVSFLTVHGRTLHQGGTGDVNKEALRLISSSVDVPVVANGGVRNLEDCYNLQETTNCKGVMVANGILNNPTLFTGTSITPVDCIQEWLNICYNTTLTNKNNITLTIPEKPANLTFQCFHHHLVFMLEKILTRSEKRIFNNLQSFETVLNFIKERFGITPQLYDDINFDKTRILDLNYDNREELYAEMKPEGSNNKFCDLLLYDSSKDNGKFFKEKVEEDCDWSSMFLEN